MLSAGFSFCAALVGKELEAGGGGEDGLARILDLGGKATGLETGALSKEIVET